MNCLRVVLGHPAAFSVHRPESELGDDVPVIRSLAEPIGGLSLVLRQAAQTSLEHFSEIGLGSRVAAFGRLAQENRRAHIAAGRGAGALLGPAYGGLRFGRLMAADAASLVCDLLSVLRRAFSARRKRPKPRLGVSAASRRRLAVPYGGFRGISSNAMTEIVHDAEFDLGFKRALLRQRRQQPQSIFVVADAISFLSVLELPGRRAGYTAKREKAAANDDREPPLHSWSASSNCNHRTPNPKSLHATSARHDRYANKVNNAVRCSPFFGKQLCPNRWRFLGRNRASSDVFERLARNVVRCDDACGSPVEKARPRRGRHEVLSPTGPERDRSEGGFPVFSSGRQDRLARLRTCDRGGFCKRHLRSGRNDDDFLGRPAGGAARTHDNVLDLPASVYRAGFHLRASRRASVIWAWVICGSSSAHLEAARSSPRAAAKLYHM